MLSLEMWSSLHLSLSLSWPGAAAWLVCLEQDVVMSEAKTPAFLLRRGLASVPPGAGPWRASLEENTELGVVLGCWEVLAPGPWSEVNINSFEIFGGASVRKTLE